MDPEPLWTLRELIEQVEAALERNYEGPESGRVRAVPDERSLRYYTSIGLLDRPAAMRGRTALYGRRHLAQVVAIKRLQAVGRSLAEIQRIVPTLDDATLSKASGVVLKGVPRPSREARASFWKAPPAAVSVPAEPRVEEGAAAAPLAAWSMPLAAGASLTLTPLRRPTDADADAIRRAAAALVAELARRGLIASPESPTKEGKPRRKA